MLLSCYMMMHVHVALFMSDHPLRNGCNWPLPSSQFDVILAHCVQRVVAQHSRVSDPRQKHEWIVAVERTIASVFFVVLSIPHRSCTQSLTPLGLSRLLVQMRPLECRLRYASHFTRWESSASTMAAALRRGGGHHGSSQWSRCCRSTQRGNHHNRNRNRCNSSQPGHQRKELRTQAGQGAQPILGDSDNLAEVKGKKSGGPAGSCTARWSRCT